MRVGFSTTSIQCQPLKFGKAESSPKNNVNAAPTFSSNTVSREEYDKLNAKYDAVAE